MTDYKLKGTQEVISGLIYSDETTSTLKPSLQVIGPRVLDGIAYVNIRTDEDLDISGTGISQTGPELSDAVVGVWYDPSVIDVTNTGTEQVNTAEGGTTTT